MKTNWDDWKTKNEVVFEFKKYYNEKTGEFRIPEELTEDFIKTFGDKEVIIRGLKNKKTGKFKMIIEPANKK